MSTSRIVTRIIPYVAAGASYMAATMYSFKVVDKAINEFKQKNPNTEFEMKHQNVPGTFGFWYPVEIKKKDQEPVTTSNKIKP